MRLRGTWIIARSVLTEAVRRREIYVIVTIAVVLIGLIFSFDFFGLDDLDKFYREISLKIMSIASAITVIVLSARQLPREFENRTIHTLLARPISRSTFLMGKLTGIILAALFCFLLFMLVYVGGTLYLGGSIPWALFLQFIYLQLIMLCVLATLCFWLSMVLNLDAAITVGILLYILGSTLMNMAIIIYPVASPAARFLVRIFTFGIPQVTLFDLSEKAIHGERWAPLGFGTLGGLTLYGIFFAAVYFGFAILTFRRRAV